MGRMVNVSVKVPEEIKELMKEVDVNWSRWGKDSLQGGGGLCAASPTL
ncbi:MAG: hypothetical protein QXU95_01910 [Candidatus Bathyarchaeia archaeon]|nr:hypothetical protein [Candidatus Bathyarchaeota archaeon]